MKIINKICPICSKSYEVPYCHKERYLTCGHKCGGILRRKPTIINICKACGVSFISKKAPKKPQDYCSRQCSAQKKCKEKIERTCQECNKIFYVAPNIVKKHSTGGKFCKNECRLKNWNKNSMQVQKPGMYRKNAWRFYEKRCYDCGITDERVLVIHHIDGNRKNGLLSNLVPVCHNCHCIRHIDLDNDGRIPSGMHAKRKKSI